MASDKKPPPRRMHLLIASVAYATFVIYGSLVPFGFRRVSFATALGLFYNIPLLSIKANGRADLVANILLFVPLSFFLLGALSVDRPQWAKFVAGLLTLIPCVALGVAIEFVQIWFPPRTVSLNDVLAQIAGAIAGTVTWWLVGQRLVDFVRLYTAEKPPQKQLVWLLRAYVIGLSIYSLLPLDLTISIHELWRKYHEGKIRLVPFTYSYSSPFNLLMQFGLDILTFVPVGAWMATFVLRRRSAWPIVTSTVLTTIFAGGIEFGQLLVYSRYMDTTDVVLAMVGGVGGAWLVRWFLESIGNWNTAGIPRPTARVRVGGLAGSAVYVGFLVAAFWYPFEFTSDAQLVRRRFGDFLATPFAALYWGSEFNAVNQVLLWWLTFMPLGAGLTYCWSTENNRRKIGWIAATLVCLAVAGVIEIGQCFLPTHAVDVVQILVSTLGGLAGGYVVQRMVSTGVPADSKTSGQEQPSSARLDVGLVRDSGESRSEQLRTMVLPCPAPTSSSPSWPVRYGYLLGLTAFTVVGGVALAIHGLTRERELPVAEIAAEIAPHSELDGQSDRPTATTDPVPLSPAATTSNIEPTEPALPDDSSRWGAFILFGTAADWRRASAEDRKQISHVIVQWIGKSESEAAFESRAAKYQQLLDECVAKEESSSAKIADWLPLIHGIVNSQP